MTSGWVKIAILTWRSATEKTICRRLTQPHAVLFSILSKKNKVEMMRKQEDGSSGREKNLTDISELAKQVSKRQPTD